MNKSQRLLCDNLTYYCALLVTLPLLHCPQKTCAYIIVQFSDLLSFPFSFNAETKWNKIIKDLNGNENDLREVKIEFDPSRPCSCH